jgi:hypothetical protein
VITGVRGPLDYTLDPEYGREMKEATEGAVASFCTKGEGEGNPAPAKLVEMEPQLGGLSAMRH